MRQALERLYGRIARGGIALLFFDGFGIQTTTRQTYFLPADAQIWTEADVAHDGLNLETVLDQMNSRGAVIKIALLDASRRNPFERHFRPYSTGPCSGRDADRHAGALLRSGWLACEQQAE
jgi:uncharacterized caspase-like protein